MNGSSLTQLLSPIPPIASLFSGATNFIWDNWTKLFVFMILGIGVLVLIHAWGYFKDSKSRVKFYTTMVPFTLSMLGLVTFDNLILLFVTWELTSILSYFLITFKTDSAEARRGGQHSLIITGLGGLALLGGIILLGATEGVWTLSAAMEVNLAANPMGVWIAGLIVLGAFTKSAQFPFHFWLGGAMSAPTPASAFLHSATMVKACIYLLYRLWPMLGGVEEVSWIVFSMGIVTFVWGSFVSLSLLDLKGVLAGTTVAHLGLMVAMISWKDHDLSTALYALVVSHAAYKAGLFLFSGVIEKIAGTRRIDLMSGLRTQSPFIFGVGLLLAGASLGLPGTLAFYAKGLMDLPPLWKFALSMGFLILGKAGLLVAVRPFLGIAASKERRKFSQGLFLMWLPPLILALVSWFTVPLGFVDGVTWEPKGIAFSILTALIAIALVRRWTPSWQQTFSRGPWLQGPNHFDRIWYAHLDFAEGVRRLVQPKSFIIYVFTMMAAFTVGMLWLIINSKLPLLISWPMEIPLNDVFVWLAVGKMVASIFILKTSTPLLLVFFLGLVGYLFALALALAGAPDLAMTQFAVETLSVLVLLYATRGFHSVESRPLRVRATSVILSVFTGIVVTIAIGAASLSASESRLRDYFSEGSWLEAHGRNVVNVILVDFRGFDTFGEITVLGVAALGVYLLLSFRRGRGLL